MNCYFKNVKHADIWNNSQENIFFKWNDFSNRLNLFLLIHQAHIVWYSEIMEKKNSSILFMRFKLSKHMQFGAAPDIYMMKFWYACNFNQWALYNVNNTVTLKELLLDKKNSKLSIRDRRHAADCVWQQSLIMMIIQICFSRFIGLIWG